MLLTPVAGVDVSEAEQAVLAVLVPPFSPLQPHVQGPLPVKLFTVPVHSPALPEVREDTAVPLTEPQAPLTGDAAPHTGPSSVMLIFCTLLVKAVVAPDNVMLPPVEVMPLLSNIE